MSRSNYLDGPKRCETCEFFGKGALLADVDACLNIARGGDGDEEYPSEWAGRITDPHGVCDLYKVAMVKVRDSDEAQETPRAIVGTNP